MGVKGRVSVISPCYNGERYVGRMLESILQQSYENLELLCVDDGSIDRTADVIIDYIPGFEALGKRLLYIRQENEGQAAAVNRGLKYISGEYLSWIDCDDFLTADSVEKKVRALADNPDCGVVTSNLYVVNEDDIETVLEKKGERYGAFNYQPRQFFLTLTGMSLMECHCHMLRVDAFRRINPALEISRCRAGQNYQILLPMYYFYNRCYIEEPLAYYVIRKDSHYHSRRNYEEELTRLDQLFDMLEETFFSMGLPDSLRKQYKDQSGFVLERRKVAEAYGRNETLVGK